jgi:hypothetical protein
MKTTERLGLRDRAWLPVSILQTVGPAEMPSVDAVRQVFWQLAAMDPDNRWLRRVDPAPGELVRVLPAEREQFMREIVVELDDRSETLGDPRVDPRPFQADLAERQRHGLGDLLFRIAVGRHYCVFEQSHALGDALIARVLWTAALRCAATGGPPNELVQPPSVRNALPRAVFRTFVTRPGQARSVVAQAREDHRASAARAATPIPVTNADPGDTPPPTPVGAVQGSASASRLESRRWWATEGSTARLQNATGRSEPGFLAELRAWRDLEEPGASVTSVLFAATLAALRESSLPPREDGVTILFDARRYLPTTAELRGNFSVGLNLDLPDPVTAATVNATIQRVVAVGRPLVTMVASLAQELTGRPVPPVAGHQSRRPAVALTAAGGLDFTGLRWLAPPGDRWHGALVTTPGPAAMTFSYIEIDDVLHANVTFDGSRYSYDELADVVRRLCASPTGVLEKQRRAFAEPPR